MGIPSYMLISLVMTYLLCQALPSVSAAVFPPPTDYDTLSIFYVKIVNSDNFLIQLKYGKNLKHFNHKY